MKYLWIGIFAAVYTLHMGARGLVAMFVSNLALPQLGCGFFFAVGGSFMLIGLLVGILLFDKWERILPTPAA